MADIDIRLQQGTATARLNDIATPIQPTDAANRAYVDATGVRISDPGTPTYTEITQGFDVLNTQPQYYNTTFGRHSLDLLMANEAARLLYSVGDHIVVTAGTVSDPLQVADNILWSGIVRESFSSSFLGQVLNIDVDAGASRTYLESVDMDPSNAVGDTLIESWNVWTPNIDRTGVVVADQSANFSVERFAEFFDTHGPIVSGTSLPTDNHSRNIVLFLLTQPWVNNSITYSVGLYERIASTGSATDWELIGGSGSLEVSSGPPSNAEEGDLWFDCDNGRTYIYISNNWIQQGGVGESGVTAQSNVIERRTPTASAMITRAELGNTGTVPIVARPINDRDGNQIANVTIQPGVGTPTPFAIEVDVTVAGWTVIGIFQGTSSLPLTPIVGDDHEWFSRFDGADSDISISLINTSSPTGIFYVDSNNGTDARLDNVLPDIGELQGLGFDIVNNLDRRYVQSNTTNPVVRNNDLDSYITDIELSNAVPVNISRDTRFPRTPENGDWHFLTANIYPPATTFGSQTVTSFLTGGIPVGSVEDYPRTNAIAVDPETNFSTSAGTVEIDYFQNSMDPQDDTITLAGGVAAGAHTFGRGFVRDRNFRGVEVRTSTLDGANTVHTSVVEHQYDSLTYSNDAGTRTNVPMRGGAVLRDYHYRQTIRTGVTGFARVRADVHYIVITSTDSTTALSTNPINSLLTASNAISMIEGFIQDGSSLEIPLAQGETLPTSFQSTTAFRAHQVTLFEVPTSPRENARYIITPRNGFTIDTTQANTYINSNTGNSADGQVVVPVTTSITISSLAATGTPAIPYTNALVNNLNDASITNADTLDAGTMLSFTGSNQAITLLHELVIDSTTGTIPADSYVRTNAAAITTPTVLSTPRGVDITVTDNAIRSWRVTFTRRFDRVAQGSPPPTPIATAGQYIRQNGWRRINNDAFANPLDDSALN